MRRGLLPGLYDLESNRHSRETNPGALARGC